MQPDCIFCKIIAGEIPSDTVYQDDWVTAFRDIHPVAPTHILLVPNQHLEDNNAITAEHQELLGHLFVVVPKLAQAEGIAASGYRLIMNCGSDGGQVVKHLHLHLIGGQPMRYPMG
jgi:histidine triad (HIT) family protein